MKSTVERFREKVVVNQDTGCWEWRGYLHIHKGYGFFWLNGKNHRAHRAAWLLFKGEIPRNAMLCHSCDNPSCVNPTHLWIGTQQENITDMVLKNRHLFGEKHPSVILSEEQVLAILDDGRMGTTIAKSYGVSKACIYDIKSRRTWSHV